MISSAGIDAWSRGVPWDNRQLVERNLVISRALVGIFSDALLRRELRFRGGTALHKLHLPKPLRFSEDIDVVRTTKGPIGPILSQLRGALEPWLGEADFRQSGIAPKLLFMFNLENARPGKLKVEINTRELVAFDPPAELPFEVSNPWFSGRTTIPTFTSEEIVATKFRALLQREKGRDLYDIGMALEVLGNLDVRRAADIFQRYQDQYGKKISRAQAQERLFGRLASPEFRFDIRDLLSLDRAKEWSEERVGEFFRHAFALAEHLPGKPWARLDEMQERFRIFW